MLKIIKMFVKKIIILILFLSDRNNKRNTNPLKTYKNTENSYKADEGCIL